MAGDGDRAQLSAMRTRHGGKKRALDDDDPHQAPPLSALTLDDPLLTMNASELQRFYIVHADLEKTHCTVAAEHQQMCIANASLKRQCKELKRTLELERADRALEQGWRQERTNGDKAELVESYKEIGRLGGRIDILITEAAAERIAATANLDRVMQMQKECAERWCYPHGR